ncbi:hypothetical protein EUCA11A_33500 [Eubacterium callanderi]|nr:hypothetical protein EUCA2A_33500 [Eubacterium callanderi]WPK73460.1 hypothetical protein EUCA11A_33500 [Eubacterium callanderi]
MAKYSFEFKKNIVLEYLSGKGGSEFLAKKYGVPQGKMVRRWIEYYQEFSEEGLRRSRKKETYSFEFKLHIGIVNISLHFFLKDIRPMLPPVMNHSTADA